MVALASNRWHFPLAQGSQARVVSPAMCNLAVAFTLIILSSVGPAGAAPWMVVDPNQGTVSLPAGASGASELSGMTWVGGSAYYAVSDQTQQMFPVTIDVDNVAGTIASATLGSGIALAGHDLEDIAYHPPTGNVLIADETGPQIRAYALADGQLLQTLSLPAVFANIRSNLSLESLTWDDANGYLWTANEEALSVDGPVSSFAAGTVVRLQRFDASFSPAGQWAYVTDPLPGDIGSPGRDIEVSGVVALVALPDGGLLVLERALGAGAILRHRIYQVDFSGASDTSALPALDNATYTPVAKTLLWSRVVGFSNLEGAALGATLDNGAHSLLLVADDGGGLNQVLYPLTVRPLICGDGVVGGSEQCDDGDTVDGDGCDATCQLEVCGDGIINNAGNEACDDGNLVDGDGCDASCGFERPVRVCQEAIGKTGRNYVNARSKALQACRNQLNRGRTLVFSDGVTPLVNASDCPDERRTAPKLARAAAKLRAALEKRCSDASLSVLATCGATVDALVTPNGTAGCLVTSHNAAVDAMLDDQYGDPVPAGETALRRCQESIAKGGGKYAHAAIGALQNCRNQMNRGRQLFADKAKTLRILDPASCAGEVRTAAKLTRASGQLRKVVSKSCDDASVGALASTCATAVDGLVTPAGDAGCLIEGHDAQVATLLEAQYRPAVP